jgi:hypothetical protein
MTTSSEPPQWTGRAAEEYNFLARGTSNTRFDAKGYWRSDHRERRDHKIQVEKMEC